MNETEVFDEETFEAILASATRIRGEIHESATINIRKAQDKQKKGFDRHHLSNSEIKVGDLILLLNNKRKDRKGGKFLFTWLGPYIVSKVTPKGTTKLKKRDSEIMKVKYNPSQLKLYVEEKTADTGGDITEFTVIVDNEKLSTSVDTRNSTPLDCNEISYWDSLPNELVEKILQRTVKESELQTCRTYQNIIQTCKNDIIMP